MARLLLPPVLAAMAVGVHWWLNVPEHVRESPHDQGVKKRSKDKARRAARDRRGRRARQRDDARSAEELERDWARFEQTAFDDEPTRTDWARRHQAIINRAVVVARRAAFEGAPDQPRVVLTETTCRTVRCRFELRSGDAKALELLTAELGRLEAEGEPVWRSYEVEPVAAPTDEEAEADGAAAKAEPEAPGKTERTVRITVAFQSDETNTRELEIPTEDDGSDAADDEAGGDPDDDEPSEPAERKGA